MGLGALEAGDLLRYARNCLLLKLERNAAGYPSTVHWRRGSMVELKELSLRRGKREARQNVDDGKQTQRCKVEVIPRVSGPLSP